MTAAPPARSIAQTNESPIIARWMHTLKSTRVVELPWDLTAGVGTTAFDEWIRGRRCYGRGDRHRNHRFSNMSYTVIFKIANAISCLDQ